MKKSKVFYLIIIYLISFFYYYNISSNYCYAAARTEEQFLSWLDDNNNYKIEEDNRIRLLNFFRVILDKANNRKSSAIIHILAGNSHYSNREDDNNSNRLSFLDTIPDGTPIKLQIYSDLNRIADLAKVGNTREIISLLNTLNLDNKPRINVLLDYIRESDVSYFKPKTNILVGSFFYSSRTDNVGSFGYDDDSSYFVTPYICPGTFLSPVIKDYKIDDVEIIQGMFKMDQIVNMRGSMYHNPDRCIDMYGTGCFQTNPHKHEGWASMGGRGTHVTNGFKFDISASGQVQTGDRVMPRTVFENLYVIISEEFLR